MCPLSRRIRRIGLLLASLLVAATSSADPSSFFTSWADAQNATGTWGGERNALEKHGVSLSSSYTADFAGNVTGGLRRGSGYAGFWELGIGADLGKLAGLSGASFAASGFWASGRSVSETYVGNLFDVQETFAPGDVYLGQLSLSQSLFGDTLTLQAGRLFAGDVFMTSPLWDYYVSSAVNGNLNSILSNVFFPEFETTAWGARVFYQPTKELEFVAGVYDANPVVGSPGQRGTDFSFDPSYGSLSMAQITWQWAQGRAASGLPGSVSVGGYYESSRFPRLDDPSRDVRGSYGLYLSFDQQLFRGAWPEFLGPDHLRAETRRAARATKPFVNQSATPQDRAVGLTLWGAVYAAPQQEINSQVLQAAAGLLWHGIIASRPRDVTALSVVSGVFSRDLPGQGVETVLELNYRVQLTPWLYLTPDFQYVVHPNGTTHIGDAAVLAGELSVTF